jgi:DNA-binding NarL/FixJ family response regulator
MMPALMMKKQERKQKIFIIDDNPLLRLGLRQIISQNMNLEVCGESSSANEALTLIARTDPDLVIVDISLDGDFSGIDVIKAVKERYDTIYALVLSSYDEPSCVDRAMRAGARGYVAKKNAHDKIIEAIEKVLSGGIYLTEAMSNRLINKVYQLKTGDGDPTMENLTKREFEIFQMIGNGFDTADITIKLGLSINTIQAHKRRIKEKLGIKNHNELVRKAAIHSASSGATRD